MTGDDLQWVDLKLLPPQVRLLAEVMGLPDTIKLLKRRGGLRVRVPTGCREDSWLKQIISPAAFDALCKSQYAGERLTLPKMDKVTDQIRNRYILTMKGKMSKSELARQYDLCIRQVQRIWNQEGGDDQNLDMFDDAV